MHFEHGSIYHIYNRGNGQQNIFFNYNNYLFFLKKVRAEWLPYCEILCYCLMPNHFHFLIIPNQSACNYVVLNNKETHLQQLSKTIGKTLSSYTQATNKEFYKTGHLFQKKTKGKLLSSSSEHKYISDCVQYIHANPVIARLCAHDTDWEFSSAKDYAGLRNGTLCNKELLFKESGLSAMDFVSMPSLPKI